MTEANNCDQRYFTFVDKKKEILYMDPPIQLRVLHGKIMWGLNELLVEPPHVKKLMVHLILQFDTIDDDSVSGGEGGQGQAQGQWGKEKSQRRGGGTIEKEKKTTLI